MRFMPCWATVLPLPLSLTSALQTMLVATQRMYLSQYRCIYYAHSPLNTSLRFITLSDSILSEQSSDVVISFRISTKEGSALEGQRVKSIPRGFIQLWVCESYLE